jgi:large subunit ribosomal protein L21
MLRRRGRTPIYAIVRSGGKQYRVETDQVLDVDRLQADVGSTVELTDVLLFSDGSSATVGAPTVADAKVVAEVLEHGRDSKIIVFKYKNKTRYRRRLGHRQDYTRLEIKQMGIGTLEAPKEKAKPKRAARKKAEPAEDTEEAPVVTAEAEVAATEVTEKPKRAASKPRKTAVKEPDAAVASTNDAESGEPQAGAPKEQAEE